MCLTLDPGCGGMPLDEPHARRLGLATRSGLRRLLRCNSFPNSRKTAGEDSTDEIALRKAISSSFSITPGAGGTLLLIASPLREWNRGSKLVSSPSSLSSSANLQDESYQQRSLQGTLKEIFLFDWNNVM